MVSPASVKKYGNAGLANHGIGTGHSWSRSTCATSGSSSRRTRSLGGAPGVDQLVLVPVPDDAARVSGLLSGQYDIGHELTPNSITQIQANSRSKTEFAGKPVTFGFGWRHAFRHLGVIHSCGKQ